MLSDRSELFFFQVWPSLGRWRFWNLPLPLTASLLSLFNLLPNFAKNLNQSIISTNLNNLCYVSFDDAKVRRNYCVRKQFSKNLLFCIVLLDFRQSDCSLFLKKRMIERFETCNPFRMHSYRFSGTPHSHLSFVSVLAHRMLSLSIAYSHVTMVRMTSAAVYDSLA